MDELIQAYPEAKVILNYRDADSWFASIQNTFGTLFKPTNFSFHYLALFEPSLHWLKQVFMRYEYGHYRGSMVRNAGRIQKEHYAVGKGAVVEKERLLGWTVEDGWEPLCEFLGQGVPNVEFQTRQGRYLNRGEVEDGDWSGLEESRDSGDVGC